MRPDDRLRWKNAALDAVLVGLGSSAELRRLLVFKGARILNLVLGTERRQSLDIDSNILLTDFQVRFKEREQQATFLRDTIEQALRKYFERLDPQRYVLKRVSVKLKPKKVEHPLGWNAFAVTIVLEDLALPEQRGVPSLTVDIAAPEEFLSDSLMPFKLGGYDVQVYTVKRIAGEKLRAFLSSLPVYRKKVSGMPRPVRAKDLYDIARIEKVHSLDDRDFWRRVGKEFCVACKSRLVDCAGLETFAEDFRVTKEAYEKDATIPDDITFDESWDVLCDIVSFFEREKMIPFRFPMKPSHSSL